MIIIYDKLKHYYHFEFLNKFRRYPFVVLQVRHNEGSLGAKTLRKRVTCKRFSGGESRESRKEVFTLGVFILTLGLTSFFLFFLFYFPIENPEAGEWNIDGPMLNDLFTSVYSSNLYRCCSFFSRLMNTSFFSPFISLGVNGSLWMEIADLILFMENNTL